MLSNLILLSILSIDSAAGSKVFRRSDSTLQGKDTIVQLFEWNWASVAAECAFLSSAGYGYVQVSPASEHITGSQWWTDYQPVSYKLTSKRGSRAQFINMVSTCNTVGVGIIVDVILNHMTAGSGIGFAGSRYSKYNYPAVPYTPSNFHYCNGNGGASDIHDYKNSYDVQFCELVGLSDLAQEQPAVQKLMAAYLNDLLSIGVAGFRIDAAKHIPAANLAAIFKLVTAPFYDTQEVVYGKGDAIDPSDYVATGSVMEFRATSTVQSYFSGQPGVASLVTPKPMGSSWGFVASSVANFIMANQDTERGGTSLNYNSPFYYLSAIFMLGFNYGTPTVYSGYNFTDSDAGAPQNSAGYTNAVTCGSNGWRCEHRTPSIANMVAFHNAVGRAPLTSVTKGSSQQIAFGRGSIGFLIINNDAKAWTSMWNTSLPAGTYCDIIHDTILDPNVCNGPSYVITDSGVLSASVSPRDALALFARASSTLKSSTAASSSVTRTSSTAAPTSTGATVTFHETASTSVSGTVVKLVGSIKPLGNWAPNSAVPLSKISGSLWSVTLVLPPDTAFQYKFIKTNGKTVVWESDPNRTYTTLGRGTSTTLSSSFR